ncbi:universal stress protein [Nesterenkonia flava]|uniref:Universal stress protein n=1 Tax=Nesterenkonia flava TaxID=469799 RepID=A0ABU1FQR2_9MICC|nr:universal stress protein [Nesterenkonia flava]MDR5710990.1 universal stress protein [Nesterenkonia flava]
MATDTAHNPSASASTRSLGVLVGFDGSDHARRALHWAAVEAQRRGLPLSIITAFTVPPAVSGWGDPGAEITGDTLARRGAEDVLEQARDYLEGYSGDVSYRVEYGDAAGVLVAHSSNAEMAAVGARGRGGFIGRVLGSVSSALPAHAECPTVVVDRSYHPKEGTGAERFQVEDDRPVVVGIDGSTGSRVAALKAAEAAVSRGVALRVVMAVPPLDAALLWYPELGPRDDWEVTVRRRRELEDRLEVQVRWLSRHFDHLVITASVTDGLPIEVLREETKGAQLTVVGTRGRGAIAATLLGSTSSGVLLHASGPVMVVPSSEDPRLESDGAAREAGRSAPVPVEPASAESQNS